jgi:hypothetical protein
MASHASERGNRLATTNWHIRGTQSIELGLVANHRRTALSKLAVEQKTRTWHIDRCRKSVARKRALPAEVLATAGA